MFIVPNLGLCLFFTQEPDLVVSGDVVSIFDDAQQVVLHEDQHHG